MKTKLVFLSILIFNVASISAQSDYSHYLNRAMEKLEAGECESARKFYNVYKELTGDTKQSVELLISECGNRTSERKYSINDKIMINGNMYRVAYIEDDGLHGLAIFDKGAGPITDEMINNRQLPTTSELCLILKNGNKLNLAESVYFWTMDKTGNEYVRTICCGGSTYMRANMRDPHGILLIHRF